MHPLFEKLGIMPQGEADLHKKTLLQVSSKLDKAHEQKLGITLDKDEVNSVAILFKLATASLMTAFSQIHEEKDKC